MESVLKVRDGLVGVRMIDRDHAELSEMTLELKLQAAAGRQWTLTSPLLRELARATVSHFALEETMMESTNYPGALLHRLQHQWMVDQVRTLTARCRRSDLQANEMLLNLLVESHFAHVGRDDLHYGLWLNGAR